MARGRSTAVHIPLHRDEAQALDAWQRSTTIPAGLQRRARVILLVAHGCTITQAARLVGMSRPKIYKWSRRYLAQGLAGLQDQPRQKEAP